MLSLVVLARVVTGLSGVALLAAAHRTRSAWASPSARSFSLLLGVLGGSAVALAAVADSPTVLHLLWLYGYLAIPMAFAAFALDYYGLDFLACPRRRAVGTFPAVAAGLAGTVLIVGQSLGADGAGGMKSAGPAAMAASPLASLPPVALDVLLALREVGLYYTTGVLIVAATLVVGTALRYDHLGRGLAATLSFVGGWPWVAYLVMPEVAAASSFGLSLAVVAGCYAASVLAVAVAFGPASLFDSLPAAATVGPRTALDSMDDAVLVVGTDGDVLRGNAVAHRTFGGADLAGDRTGQGGSGLVGRPLEDALDVDLATLRADDRLSLDTVEGARWFRPTVSPIDGRDGTALGSAVVLRDVTRRRTREQRLAVLNRVLRHNLRNDMNVIRGHAELIADGGNLDPETGAEQIRATADDLVQLGERAREVERMMAFEERDGRTDPGSVVGNVVGAASERYPGVSFTTALPDDVSLPVDDRVLRVVLRNVVDNACEHNDADDPLVVVSADRVGDRFRIAVSDNGPGIPEMERSVVDEGNVDPLEHGTGLGLWAVQWGVTRLGGRLSFADNDPRGTVVRIDLPLTARGGEGIVDAGSPADPARTAGSPDAVDTAATAD